MTQLERASTVRGSFAGTAQVFSETMNSQVILTWRPLPRSISCFGVLYESYVHPLIFPSRCRRQAWGVAGAGAVWRAL